MIKLETIKEERNKNDGLNEESGGNEFEWGEYNVKNALSRLLRSVRLFSQRN